jgi:glycosyltransferase involved in cell wall biosynthesis
LGYGPVTTKFSTYALHKIAVISAGISLEGYPDELAKGLYLIPPEDTQALLNIFTYLQNHPEDRARKAKILNDFASTKLTWESVAREILEVINDNRN